MSRGEHGEQVDATGAHVETGRGPAPWCRYAASCYKSRLPLHECGPEGRRYVDGCPMDEGTCRSALLVSGRMSYEATREDRRAEKALKGWRTCCRCGTWFRYRHGNERYCSDACRAEAHRQRCKRYAQENRDVYNAAHRRWAEEHREERNAYQREYRRRKEARS